MEQASLVVIVPGYGMAVAQAQHRVRELYDQLTKRGVDVKFAIHPVAGRMPGHMNVLLAEAEIPYEKLVEMDDINPDMPQADVVLVIGANDVVNPAARHDKSSPIFGMPIIDADKAKTVLRHQAQHEPGLRRHRERALLRRQHLHALRRRQGRAHRPGEAALGFEQRALRSRGAGAQPRRAGRPRPGASRQRCATDAGRAEKAAGWAADPPPGGPWGMAQGLHL